MQEETIIIKEDWNLERCLPTLILVKEPRVDGWGIYSETEDEETRSRGGRITEMDLSRLFGSSACFEAVVLFPVQLPASLLLPVFLFACMQLPATPRVLLYFSI